MAPEPGFTSDGYNTLILKDEQSDWQNNEWALFQVLIKVLKDLLILSTWARWPAKSNENILEFKKMCPKGRHSGTPLLPTFKDTHFILFVYLF